MQFMHCAREYTNGHYKGRDDAKPKLEGHCRVSNFYSSSSGVTAKYEAALMQDANNPADKSRTNYDKKDYSRDGVPMPESRITATVHLQFCPSFKFRRTLREILVVAYLILLHSVSYLQ